MSATKATFPQPGFALADAERVAKKIVERLAPFAQCVEIAGSIRRQRPRVNDIDLVAIPRVEMHGLFGQEKTAPRDSALVIELCSMAAYVGARGDKVVRVSVRVDGPLGRDTSSTEISVDLYLAAPETWTTLLLIRTGSAQHNIWLCQRARELGAAILRERDVLPDARLLAHRRWHPTRPARSGSRRQSRLARRREMITRFENGKKTQVRPSFAHHGNNGTGFPNDAVTAQLTEDIRNILEEIRDKQMLQCDVRADIREIARTLRSINRKLPNRRSIRRKK